jgi:hypothetical protein
MKLLRVLQSFVLVISIMGFASCTKEKTPDEEPITNSPYSNIQNTYGYNLLDKVKGIWNGPVTSTTPLGGYPEWIVDFRPISENQISAKNELDTLNDIYMSFFIAKYNNEYRLAFRNGGSFGGQTRVSYFLVDSVSETSSHSFYRFSEIIIGKNRAYTDVLFKDDSLIISSFTNNYNTQSTATPHMTWRAKLQDETSCEPAVNNFNFPKKTLTKDFTNTFNGQAEAVYYSITGGDPYPETDQPYLGKTIINYSYLGTYTPNPATKVFIIITTQPMISGVTFNSANLKYRSRYVILDADDNSYTFNYMHPGTYYLYALYDQDGNKTASSGDWISATNTTFSIGSLQTISASTVINFTIP